MVKADHDFSTQHHRFRGGRSTRLSPSYSNHARNHMVPYRHSSSPFGSAYAPFQGKDGVNEQMWRCEKREKFSRWHDTPLVLLIKTAIRPFVSIVFVRPESCAKVHRPPPQVNLYRCSLPVAGVGFAHQLEKRIKISAVFSSCDPWASSVFKSNLIFAKPRPKAASEFKSKSSFGGSFASSFAFGGGFAFSLARKKRRKCLRNLNSEAGKVSPDFRNQD